MRTTINLDEGLLARARERAARQRTTLSDVVRHALEAQLAAPPAGAPAVTPFVLVTAGRPGARYPSPERVFALLEEG